MNPKTREQLLRILLAGFLNSQLTMKDLRRLAEELRYDSNICYEFGALLHNVLQQLSETAPLKKDDMNHALFKQNQNPKVHSSGLAATTDAYTVIQRRRLSKREVSLLMESTGFAFEETKIQDMSMRELLNHFFSVASELSRQQFLAKLDIHIENDPYLQGINRNR